MSKIIETEVFEYDELDERAKEKARAWFSQHYPEFEWWDDCYERIKDVGEILGFEFDKKRDSIAAYFDTDRGAYFAFHGGWTFKAGATKAIRAYAPKDDELHRIARELFKAARRTCWNVSARVRAERNDASIRVDTDDWFYSYEKINNEQYHARREAQKEIEEAIQEAIQDFCHWALKLLGAELEYLQSEENIEEMRVIHVMPEGKGRERF